MIELRPFSGIGHANHGWLDARHHFSFADYYDPARMAWGNLRVWNDDTIAAKSGFPPHPHRDMEIITYVRTGAITPRDSLGNQGRTAAGDVQVMSAGTGITHAEYNLEDEATTLFQIWIQPTRRGLAPGWGARQFPRGDRAGQLVVLASGYPEDADALPIRTEARLVAGTIRAGETLDYALGAERKGYLVPATGAIRVEGAKGSVHANARDGIAIAQEEVIRLTAIEDSEVVLVDTV